MTFTGLAEFFWFLLVFGGLFAFTMWRQQRDRRRRQERMAAMSPPAALEPLPVPREAAPDLTWGRGPAAPMPPRAPRETFAREPTRPETAPLEAPPPETAPDIAWGRGHATSAPPPEIAPDWREAPRRTEAAAVPAWTPRPSRAPRRAAPAAARRGLVDFRSEAGLRQAMIALTVLGPCRALEPYGGDTPRPGGTRRPPQRG